MKKRWIAFVAVCVMLSAVTGVPATSPAGAQDTPTCNGLEATIVGTDSDDVLNGTNKADVIVGLGGNDTITGGNGNDVICGNDGDDTIDAGNGDDYIEGGDGNDDLDGERGDDTIHGGNDDDTIVGERGNDTLDGGNGTDTVDGDRGTDTCDDAETAINCETETNNGEDGGVLTAPTVDAIVDDLSSGNDLTVTFTLPSGSDPSSVMIVDPGGSSYEFEHGADGSVSLVVPATRLYPGVDYVLSLQVDVDGQQVVSPPVEFTGPGEAARSRGLSAYRFDQPTSIEAVVQAAQESGVQLESLGFDADVESASVPDLLSEGSQTTDINRPWTGRLLVEGVAIADLADVAGAVLSDNGVQIDSVEVSEVYFYPLASNDQFALALEPSSTASISGQQLAAEVGGSVQPLFSQPDVLRQALPSLPASESGEFWPGLAQLSWADSELGLPRPFETRTLSGRLGELGNFREYFDADTGQNDDVSESYEFDIKQINRSVDDPGTWKHNFDPLLFIPGEFFQFVGGLTCLEVDEFNFAFARTEFEEVFGAQYSAADSGVPSLFLTNVNAEARPYPDTFHGDDCSVMDLTFGLADASELDPTIENIFWTFTTGRGELDEVDLQLSHQRLEEYPNDLSVAFQGFCRFIAGPPEFCVGADVSKTEGVRTPTSRPAGFGDSEPGPWQLSFGRTDLQNVCLYDRKGDSAGRRFVSLDVATDVDAAQSLPNVLSFPAPRQLLSEFAVQNCPLSAGSQLPIRIDVPSDRPIVATGSQGTVLALTGSELIAGWRILDNSVGRIPVPQVDPNGERLNVLQFIDNRVGQSTFDPLFGYQIDVNGLLTHEPVSTAAYVSQAHVIVEATSIDGRRALRAISIDQVPSSSEEQDLRLRYTVSRIPIEPGLPVAVQIQVENRGESPVEDVFVRFDFPSDLLPPTFGQQGSDAACALESVVATIYRCELGSLDPESSESFVILLDVPADFVADGQVVDYELGTPEVANQEGSIPLYDLFSDVGNFGPPCGSPALANLGRCIAATSKGDPHLITLDGQPYDLQTVGEYVWIADPISGLAIHNRTGPRGLSRRVSVNVGAAAKVGSDTVEIGLSSDVLINGELTTLDDGQVIELGGGAFVARSGGTVSVVWPGTGVRPRLDVEQYGGSFVNLNVSVPAEMAGSLVGLLGDGDGDRSNDFRTRSGVVIDQPISANDLYNLFSLSWRLTDEESLFTYPEGQGTADFTDLTYPSSIVQLADLDSRLVQAARVQCEQAGISDPVLRDACALDLIITEDPLFLAGYLNALRPSGVGNLNTIRNDNGDPVLIPGIADIVASPGGGVLYAAIESENKIVTINPITGETADFATIDAPTDLDVDADGNVYAITQGTLISVGSNGTGTLTRIDVSTGAQTVLRDNLLRPIDVEVTANGEFAYIHVAGFSWFGSPAHGIRLFGLNSGSFTTIANGFRLDPLSGLSLDDSTGIAYWQDRTSIRTHTVADGLATATGFADLRFGATAADGAFHFVLYGGPFGLCDSRNNAIAYRQQISPDGVVSGDRIVIAGGSAGFADSTFGAPNGSICQTSNAMTYADNRIYINDAGNDAIRYVGINP